MIKLGKYFIILSALSCFCLPAMADDTQGHTEFSEDATGEIAAFENQIAELDEKLKQEEEALKKEYEMSMYDTGEEIAELTLKLAELQKQDKKEKGEGETDPEKIRQESVDALSFVSGKAYSLADDKKLKKSRLSKLTNSISGALSSSGKNVAQTTAKKEQQELMSENSNTQKGASEALSATIDSVVNQVDALYKYLLVELTALEADTVSVLSSSTIAVKDAGPAIDICKYSGEETGFMGAIKNTKNQLEGAVGEAQAKIAQGQAQLNKLSSMKEDITSSVSGLKNDYNSTLSGLSGMQ